MSVTVGFSSASIDGEKYHCNPAGCVLAVLEGWAPNRSKSSLSHTHTQAKLTIFFNYSALDFTARPEAPGPLLAALLLISSSYAV